MDDIFCYIYIIENPIPDFVMEMISDLRRLMKKHCEDSTSDDRDTTDRGIFFYDI